MNDDLDFSIDFDVDEALKNIEKLTKSFDSLKKRSDSLAKGKGPMQATQKELQQVESQLKRLLSRVDQYAAKFSKALMSGVSGALTKSMAAVKTAMASLFVVAAAAAAGLGAGISAALRKGLDEITALDGARDTVAATVSNFYDLKDALGAPLVGFDRVQAAALQAKDSLEELRKQTVLTGASEVELGAALSEGMSAGAGAGLTREVTEQIVADIANAASAVGVASADFHKEVKALMTGAGLDNSALGKQLQLDPQAIQLWREQGTLAQELAERLEDLKNSAAHADQGIDTLSNRMKVGITRQLAQAASGASEEIKASLNTALSSLFDKEGNLMPQFQALYDVVESTFSGLGAAIGSAIEGAADAAAWLSEKIADNEDTVAAVQEIFAQVVGSLQSAGEYVIDFFKNMGSLNTSTLSLEKAFKGISIVIGAIKDGINGIAGATQMVVGTVMKAGSNLVAFGAKRFGMEEVKEFYQNGAMVGQVMLEAGKAQAAAALDMTNTQAALEEDFNAAIERRKKLMAETAAARQAEREERKREEAERKAKRASGDSGRLNARAQAQTAAAKKAAADRIKALEAEKKAAEELSRALEAVAAAHIAAARQAAVNVLAERGAELDMQVAQALLSKKEELKARQALELEGVRAEAAAVAAEKERLSASMVGVTDASKLATIDAQIIGLQSRLDTFTSKERVLVFKASVDMKALEDEIKAEKERIQQELDSLAGLPENLAAQRAAALDTALAKSDTALQGQINRLFDAKEARAAFDSQAAKVSQIQQDLAGVEAEYQRLFEAGALSILEYERKIRDARLASATALKDAAKEMKTAADKTGNKELIDQAKTTEAGIQKVADAANKVGVEAVGALRSSFKEAFTDITRGAKSVGEALLDIFSSVLNRIADLLAEDWIGALLKPGSSSSGTGGGFADILSNLFTSLPRFADGGPVPGSGTGTDRSDSVVLRAARDEYIVNSADSRANRGLLDHINSGKTLEAFAPVQQMVARAGATPQIPTPTFNNTISPTFILDQGELANAVFSHPRTEGQVVKLMVANKSRVK